MRSFLSAAVAGATILAAPAVHAQSDFEWHNRLAPGQIIEIKGINGDIHAVAATSGEAEVTATKSARHGDPADVRIEVVPHGGGVTICAVYPDVAGQEPNRCEPGPGGHSHTRDNDTVVRFEVRVPPGVRFFGRTVNGSIAAESLGADAEAHTVNGSVRVSTNGVATGSTVNGSLNLAMGRVDWPSGAKLSTVNGGITLRLPSTLNADLSASTVNGAINSEFPITVTGTITRRRLQGTIGNGGQHLTVSTVNGSIRLLKGQ